MGQTLQATQTAEIDVAPELAARITALLSTYHDLKAQADLLYEQMDVENAKIWDLMKEAGLKKIVVGDVPCTEVGGESSKLDKIKFVQLGGSLEMLANATERKPKKKYLLIGKEKEAAAA